MDLMIQMDSIHTMDLATKPIGPWTSHRIHRPKPGIIIGSSSSVNNLAGDVERSWFFVDGMGSSWLKPWKLTMITMDVDGITWTNDDSICFCLFFFQTWGIELEHGFLMLSGFRWVWIKSFGTADLAKSKRSSAWRLERSELLRYFQTQPTGLVVVRTHPANCLAIQRLLSTAVFYFYPPLPQRNQSS